VTAELTELVDPCPLANPHLYTDHDVYGMGYFRWPTLAMLPPRSCTPAH